MVAVFDIAHVAPAQRLHHRRDLAGRRRCQQQVHVVGHQHVGVDGAAEAPGDVPQLVQIAHVVDGMEEARPAVVASLEDMLGKVGQVDAGLAGHGGHPCGEGPAWRDGCGAAIGALVADGSEKSTPTRFNPRAPIVAALARMHDMTPLRLVAVFPVVLALAACGDRGAAGQGDGAAEHARGQPAAPLPLAREVALQPQPGLRTLDFPPVVQEFAPGQLVMHAPKMDLRVERVRYGPYGMAIDLVVDQRQRDPQTFLNGGDKGVLRDDAGGVYRIKEDAHMLDLHMGKAGDAWKATLQAYGFVPADARTMTLSLNVASFWADDAMVQVQWPVPDEVRARRRMLQHDAVEPGRGWRFAVPPIAMGPDGTLGVRVYGVEWLRDGIALDMELVNGRRDSAQPVFGARLVDDKRKNGGQVHLSRLGSGLTGRCAGLTPAKRRALSSTIARSPERKADSRVVLPIDRALHNCLDALSSKPARTLVRTSLTSWPNRCT